MAPSLLIPTSVGFYGKDALKLRILLAEDEESFVHTVRLAVKDDDIEVVVARNGAEAIEYFKKDVLGYATAVIDFGLPDMTGADVVRALKMLNSRQDFIFCTGKRNFDNAVEFMDAGGQSAFYFKAQPKQELRRRILDSIEIYKAQLRPFGSAFAEPSHIARELSKFNIVGKSQGMFDVLEKVRQSREEKFPVLIIGESGTGKELIANIFAEPGDRPIVVHCPSFSQNEQLLESTLFGYKKGAFTGAEQDTAGLLENANGKVVFFDELHRLSLTSQSKLLRLLQEMTFRRVGDHSGRERKLNFRVVAAAKPIIHQMVEDETFMEDIYFRVAHFKILIPPLRERPDDIMPLLRKCEDEFNANKPQAKQKQFDLATMHELAKLPWAKGNVRELQAAATQLLACAKNPWVEPSDLAAFRNYQAGIDIAKPPPAEEGLTQARVIQGLCHSQTLTGASQWLGISRWALNRALARFKINPDQYLISSKEKP